MPLIELQDADFDYKKPGVAGICKSAEYQQLSGKDVTRSVDEKYGCCASTSVKWSYVVYSKHCNCCVQMIALTDSYLRYPAQQVHELQELPHDAVYMRCRVWLHGDGGLNTFLFVCCSIAVVLSRHVHKIDKWHSAASAKFKDSTPCMVYQQTVSRFRWLALFICSSVIMRPSLGSCIKCCTLSVHPFVPCIQFSWNRKAVETSNLVETTPDKSNLWSKFVDLCKIPV